MEFIEKAGEEAYLDKRLSRKIGAQTLLGAAKMLIETGEKPDVLRENITSPNGTTEAHSMRSGQKAAEKPLPKPLNMRPNVLLRSAKQLKKRQHYNR